MSLSVALTPLNCLACKTPIPAASDEVAWVCVQCGAGTILTGEDSLAPLQLRYSAAIAEGQIGRPFWVVDVEVDMSVRRSTEGDTLPEGPQPWEKKRTFFLPAYASSLMSRLSEAKSALYQPPPLAEGSRTAFQPIVLSREDIGSYIEFTIISIESEREDKLIRLDFQTHLGEPELWVLP